MQFKSAFLLGLVFAIAAVNAAPVDTAKPEGCTPVGGNTTCCWYGAVLGCSQMKKGGLASVVSTEAVANATPNMCTPVGGNMSCCWYGGTMRAEELASTSMSAQGQFLIVESSLNIDKTVFWSGYIIWNSASNSRSPREDHA
ncbi:hypothetical protein BGX21_008802 [Mortierella sp. AD011]|nr:hypothetical protein BGX21_008802 [Mortierella sp. AD011]